MGAAGGERSSGAAYMKAVVREEAADGTTVFRPPAAPPPHSPVRTTVALTLWLGAIHFNLLLVLASVFFFHKRTAALVLGTQLFLAFAPVSYTSRLGRSIARFICKHAVHYFPITLHVEDYAAFDPNTAYVFAYEPHSAWPLGLWVLSARMGFMPTPKLKILASSAAFYTPFQRQIWTWLGLVPASRENFCHYLTSGYSCAVVPGGLREMLHMDHDHDSEVAFIRSRKGFVKIALQTGCPLVPVFCFGQGNLYNWWRPKSISLLKIAREIKSPPIVFWGKFGTHIPFGSPMHVFVGRPIEFKKNDQPTMDEVTNLVTLSIVFFFAHSIFLAPSHKAPRIMTHIPFGSPMHVFVGTPIEFKKNDQPTMDEINEVHERFIIALQDLFNKHKNKTGSPNLQLRVI